MLETLEAETPDGTLHAQRAEDSFVGEIADGRVIGIAFQSEVGGPPDADDRRAIVVHLYDGPDPAVLLGELDEQGAASLQPAETVFFDASVDLVVADDVITGTVTYGDEEPVAFTASLASGVGRVYWAHGEDDWEHRSAAWVVTPDGRQWGAICMPTMYRGSCGAPCRTRCARPRRGQHVRGGPTRSGSWRGLDVPSGDRLAPFVGVWATEGEVRTGSAGRSKAFRATDTYPIHAFDSTGATTVMHARVDEEGTWICTGEGIRFTGRFRDDAHVLSGRWELPSPDGRVVAALMAITLRRVA